MQASHSLDLLAVGPAGAGDLAVAVAARRAGYGGLLPLADGNLDDLDRALDLVDSIGVVVTASEPLDSTLPEAVELVLLREFEPSDLAAAIAPLQAPGRAILVEVTTVESAAAAAQAGAMGLVAKGHEAGGFVGSETAFILLQRLLAQTALPIWVEGGVGPHTAAGCVAAGARGILLSQQLALTVEADLPPAAQELLARLDGSETALVGDSLGCPCRILDRPHGLPAVEALRELEAELAGKKLSRTKRRARWRGAVSERLGWGPSEVPPAGMELALAAPLAAQYRTVAGVLQAFATTIQDSLAAAAELDPLAPGGPLAAAHGTEFPVVQGPMTRVSDNPEFAKAVADGGGLPFIALALLDGDRSLELLQATADRLAGQPWGAGLLGFVEPELRAAQVQAVLQVKPPWALLAGGRPSQAKELDDAGIPAYLHVPSPRLLQAFVKDGARRFVFEGRECGGHIGPRSSLLLWDQAIELLLDEIRDGDGSDYHLLFAGGIHDARSAAAVAAAAAPLAQRGAKIGVLVGTAYLFTKEAVATGAVVEQFQQEALDCDTTAVIEASAGHAIRVAPTPAAEAFNALKQELLAQGLTAKEVAAELERHNLGRLRIASRGVTRNPAHETDPKAPRLVPLSNREQRRQGLYMLGQIAPLRAAVTTIREVHQSIAACGELLPAMVEHAPQAVVDPSRTEIAIVGMAALLPGSPDVETFWRTITEGIDAVREVAPERWDPALYFDPESRGGDHTYSKWGGFLDPILFDPLTYGIPPRSLYTIEPVHLLALEVVRRALVDAGYERRPFRRERTAVVFGAGGGSSDLSNAFGFRGMMAHFLSAVPGAPDAAQLLDQLDGVLPQWCEDTFPGVLINVIAGRVANRFNFGGANFTIDAACASSLAAVDAAVKELRLGHCDVALAGGADTTQDIFSYLLFANSLVLSPRGKCRPFDESADGIAIGEGVAAVVLKRLADAERDGDRVYAIIRGVAGSSDGRALGLTAPSLTGQARAVAQAYERSGISPATVELVEAHGTGTAVGDRTEVEALSRVFEPADASPGRVAIGSVKSNIGHTKCAAGLASLVKTAQAVWRHVLPPTLHVEVPNAKAGFGRNPFYPNRELRPWLNGTNGHPRRAAVSAFGFGGTNFHLVLEEHTRSHLARPAGSDRRSSELLLWRAADPAELAAQLTNLAEQLQAGATPRLRDLAFSLALAWDESDGATTLAIVASGVESLSAQLELARGALAGQPVPAGKGVYYSAEPLLSNGKLACLFPGQGSQYPHMLGELAAHFPVVAERLEAADRVLLEAFPEGLSRRLFPPSAYTADEAAAQVEALTRTEVAQPALGACDAAVLALLESCGITPDLAAGHSYGEYVALYAAGVFDYPTLLQLSVARGQAIAACAGDQPGAMAAVKADEATCAAALAGLPGLTIANLNSPSQTVIAGSDEALAAGLERLAERKLTARRLPVACAFHSPLMSAAADRLRAALGAVEFAAPRFPVYSNTTGAAHDPAQIAVRLAEHLTSPVRFVDQLEAMWDAGGRVFVEVGPNRVLTGLVSATFDGRPQLAVASDQKGGAGVDRFHQLLGQLAAEGAAVRPAALFVGREVAKLALGGLPREAPPSPTSWRVSGGRSEPLNGVPKPVTAKSAPPLAEPQPVANGGESGLVAQFQATMQQALEQQQRVVREALASQQQVMEYYLTAQQAVLGTYLGGEPVAIPPLPALGAALPAMPAPVTPAVAPEPVPAPEPVAVAELAPTAADEFDLTATLLRLVSERTGYPPEMLGMDLDLEAELGVDSIKRIEILSSLSEQLPAGGDLGIEDAMEELAQQKTIRQVTTWLAERLAQAGDGAVAAAPEATVPAAEVQRHLVQPVAVPPVAKRRPVTRGPVLVAGRGALAEEIAEVLKARKWPVVAVREWPTEAAAAAALRAAPVSGLVLVPEPWDGDPDELRTGQAVRGGLLLAQACAADLSRPRAFGILALTQMGGSFGLAGGEPDPLAGGVAGLTKSLARELPEAVVKVVDLDPSEPMAQAVARALDEQLSAADQVEVGLPDGGRLRLDCVATPATGGALELAAGSVVLLTGGARGITAEIAVTLANRWQPTLVLVGRSPLPEGDEPAATAGLTDLAELKAALAKELGSPKPAEVEQAYGRLLKSREVRRTLARLTAAGAQVEYHALDVRDDAAFGQLLQAIYAQHGRLDGVIHGAGAIEDRRLAHKTPELVDRVWGPKLDGAATLLAHLQPETLRFLVFFTSVAGRFGNRGQTDYAAANDALARLAGRLDAAWPTRVVAVDWGPWDELGMVQPELRRLMTERGVTLVSPQVGCELLLAELTHGCKGQAEVVIAALGADGAAVL